MFVKHHRIITDRLPLVLAALALSACGAGMFDHTTRIIGDYLYADAGGDGRAVVRFQEGIGETIVISPRVDKIELDGTRILIARRPRTSIPGPGGSTSRLEPTCEYWYIDSRTHEIGQFDPGNKWPTLKCRMTD
jgi:hypothetical protein